MVTVNTAGWTERDNVLASYGDSAVSLASAYDLTVMEWLVVASDGDVTWGDGIVDIGEPESGVTVLVDYPLNAIAGSVATLPEDASDASLAGWFVSSAKIGGLTRTELPTGSTTIATLSLEIADAAGTYQLKLAETMFVNGSAYSDTIDTSNVLTISVGAK